MRPYVLLENTLHSRNPTQSRSKWQPRIIPFLDTFIDSHRRLYFLNRQLSNHLNSIARHFHRGVDQNYTTRARKMGQNSEGDYSAQRRADHNIVWSSSRQKGQQSICECFEAVVCRCRSEAVAKQIRCRHQITLGDESVCNMMPDLRVASYRVQTQCVFRRGWMPPLSDRRIGNNRHGGRRR